MTIRVYVSGASAELDQLEPLVVRLRRDVPGIKVLDRWMREVKTLRALGRGDADLSPTDARMAAWEDLLDVVNCDALVFVVPSNNSRGAWVELGFAMARRPPRGIYVLGDLSRSIFLRDKRVTPVLDVEALVAALRAAAALGEPRRPS